MDDAQIDQIRQVEDPLDRAKAALEAQAHELKVVAELGRIRREALDVLIKGGMKQVDIAKALKISRSRMSQLVTSGPGPERALVAPQAKIGTVVTIAVVQKKETERTRPALLMSTRDAVAKLDRLIHKMDLDTRIDAVPDAGTVDLNRDNLVVLVGPRISPLVAQAITADPAIQWRRDAEGHWFIIDAKAGIEYHSDFDAREAGDRTPRTCFAHIGRIERPDRRGSFLYLSGAHGPGTAGAVEVLCRDITALWDQVHRNLWSAVVKTTSDAEGGEVLTAEIVSPVYVHTKR